MRLASLALATTGLYLGSAAAPAQIRMVHVSACDPTGTTCAVPSTGSGNLIVIGRQLAGGANRPSRISRVRDNAGNIYSSAEGVQSIKAGDGSAIGIWYSRNSLPGVTSVTITPPGTANGIAVIWEFAGVDRTARLDQFNAKDWADLITSARGTAGKAVSSKAAPLAADGANACDLNGDGIVNVLDGQLAVNMIGSPQCTANIAGAGVCNSEVVSRVLAAALGGPCVTGIPHSVLLNWRASSTANVAGYNVYRRSGSEASFTKINSSLVLTTSYTDADVQAGETYYYVATTVDTTNSESIYSNVASARIPLP
jgi:hypothetical protein